MTGKTLLAGLVIFMLVFMANGSALAQGGFGNGCVVREWATDPTPSYRVNDPSQCAGLDQQLDGGDGPNRGRVRADFQSGNNSNRKKKTGNWN
jgi:hypothetical protein